MLKFDLSEAMAAAERAVSPWDFTLTVNGKDYPTRPLKTFELGTLKRLDAMSEAEQRTFFESLFVREPNPSAPDLSDWNEEMLGAAAVAIVTVFAERAKKKSLLLQRQVAQAVREERA